MLHCIHTLAACDWPAAVRHAKRNLRPNDPSSAWLLAKALIADGTELGQALHYAEQAVRYALPTVEKISLLSFIATEHMRAWDFRRGARILGELNDLDGTPSAIPKWKGERLMGKTVLLACGSPLLERNGQVGFGDEILWARFGPLLARLGARVYLRCHPALQRLFASLDSVHITTTVDIPARPDYLINEMTIPWRLGLARDDIPSAPYLTAAPRGDTDSDAFKVGLSWGCSAVGPQNRYCSLAELSSLAGIPGVQLYSLEKTHHAEQLRPPPVGMPIIDLAPRLADFADTASAISAMDAICSMDNVIANLAGALGKPLYVLHAFSGAEYRWGDGGTTPWFPSARVFRQPRPGDWRSAAGHVGCEIRATQLQERKVSPCLEQRGR